MFQGGCFMIITKSKFMGYQLKKEILEHEDFSDIDILLFKTFCIALEKLPQNIDENKFQEYFEYNYDLIDKACFIILIFQLGNDVFNYNPSYIAELCLALTINEISPQKFNPITHFFFDKKISSLITRICYGKAQYDGETQETYSPFGYISIFDILIKRFDISNLSEWEKNKILKTLHAFLQEDYRVLFGDNNTLEDVFITLYNKMCEINKKHLTYNAKDFSDIALLKTYIKTPDSELKSLLLKDLIDCEKENYDNKTIIDKCLKTIREYRYRFTQTLLIRKRKNENQHS